MLWILPLANICIDHTDDCRHAKIHKHKRPDFCVCVFLRISLCVFNLPTGFCLLLLRCNVWAFWTSKIYIVIYILVIYFQIFAEKFHAWGATVGAGMVVLDIERRLHRLLFFSPVIIQFSKLAPVLSMLLERVGARALVRAVNV